MGEYFFPSRQRRLNSAVADATGRITLNDRGLKPIGIYTSSGFPESHHRQVVDGSILTYRTHKNTPESHHRQVVDGSIPACALNNGKQGLGLNHPPPAGGGIPRIFPVRGRPGLNDPPATASGIWLNINLCRYQWDKPVASLKRAALVVAANVKLH